MIIESQYQIVQISETLLWRLEMVIGAWHRQLLLFILFRFNILLHGGLALLKATVKSIITTYTDLIYSEVQEAQNGKVSLYGNVSNGETFSRGYPLGVLLLQGI